MIQETINSFADNFRQKATNPYLGTVLGVWCFENWPLIYGLFNFDSDCKLSDKTGFIQQYFFYHPFFDGLWKAIGVSMLVLIGTYILLNISRLIVNFFDKVITPLAYKVTDKSSIVLKTDFDNLLKDNIELQKRLESERDNRAKWQSEREKLEQQLSEAILNKEDNKTKSSGTVSAVRIVDSEIEGLIGSLIQNSHPSLRKIIESIEKTKPVPSRDITASNMLKLGLIKEIPEDLLTQQQKMQANIGEKTFFEFTKLGKRVSDAYKEKYD